MKPGDGASSKTPMTLAGFTLLEILIATLILAVVLSIIFVSYRGTYRNIEETSAQAEIYGMARVALERITEDLESVYMIEAAATAPSGGGGPPPGRFVGADAQIDGRSADTLRFLSRAHLVFAGSERGSGTAEIVYSVTKSVEGDHFLLYRSDTAELEETSKDGDQGLILCDNLHSVNITYYDEKDQTHDHWNSTENEFKDRLPRRVAILLEFVNPSNPEIPLRFETGAALPMSRGRYGKAS